MQSPKVIRPFSSSEFFRVERPRQRFQHARENLGWSLENGDLLFLQSKENPAAWKILDHHWFELIVSWWQYFQKKKKKGKNSYTSLARERRALLTRPAYIWHTWTRLKLARVEKRCISNAATTAPCVRDELFLCQPTIRRDYCSPEKDLVTSPSSVS